LSLVLALIRNELQKTWRSRWIVFAVIGIIFLLLSGGLYTYYVVTKGRWSPPPPVAWQSTVRDEIASDQIQLGDMQQAKQQGAGPSSGASGIDSAIAQVTQQIDDDQYLLDHNVAPVQSYSITLAALFALWHRAQTGQGQYVDCSQLEAGMVLYDVQSPPVPPAMVPVSTTVPIIYNSHDTTFAAGQYVSSRAVAMVLRMRKELAPDIVAKVDLYRWTPYSGLTAHSRKGWLFALGFHLGDDLQIRLDALDAAYKAGIMNRHHCNFVDLEPMPKIYCNYQLQWHGSWGPGSR